jgi:hypothetical protein
MEALLYTPRPVCKCIFFDWAGGQATDIYDSYLCCAADEAQADLTYFCKLFLVTRETAGLTQCRLATGGVQYCRRTSCGRTANHQGHYQCVSTS